MAIIIVQISIAQNEEPVMITDRPDQTESAIIVPHKRLQIESGFTFGWNEYDGISSKNLGFNSTLLRYGIHPRLELRMGVAYAGYEEEYEESDHTTKYNGFAPLVIGLKWNFLEGDGPIPTMALLSHIDIPAIASDDFNDGNVLQNIVLAGSWELSSVFSFGFNFGTRVDWKQSDFTTIYTTSLGMGITKWLGAFVEFYGFLPDGEYSDHRFDMGFTFPVRHNLQFDVSGGMGISKNSPDGFAGFGFAWRLPR